MFRFVILSLLMRADTNEACMKYELTYWSGKGKYQVLYDAIKRLLIAEQGEASSPAGEIVRLISNLYYERFNNGGSFSSGQRKEDGKKLLSIVKFPIPISDKQWDLVVDIVLERAWIILMNEPKNLLKIISEMNLKTLAPLTQEDIEDLKKQFPLYYKAKELEKAIFFTKKAIKGIKQD